MNKCGSHLLDLTVSSLQGNKIDGKTILLHFDAFLPHVLHTLVMNRTPS